MESPMMQPDWSRPQRQPIAGLAIVFLNTCWQVLKRIWPFLLLMLFRKQEGKVNSYEIITMVFLAVTVISAVLRFIYFRFYIEEDKLVIKKGWLNKETKMIPLEKIQTVHIEQGPLHQVLNIVKLSVDTAGTQKAEAVIDALHHSMAEALKAKLLAKEDGVAITESAKVENREPVIRLTDKDLLKLSISANHLEAFFLLLSFGFGLYQNLKDIDNNLFSGIQSFLPEKAVYPILFLSIAILLITILLSTARIFFRFYNFTVFRSGNGFQIKSGLFHVKERLIAFQKIQYVSWKANWIRKLLGLWLLEYHTAGGEQVKQNLKVQLPVTQSGYISLLVNDYCPLPQITDQTVVRMNPAFVMRRLIIFGLLPSLIIIPFLWLAWGEYSLLFLCYPLVIFIVSWSVQRKFRLWALNDVLYIKKGIFGEERVIMQWYKMQSIQLKQSLYQRRKNLASIVLYTAGGNVTINFISLEAARQLLNFGLYKTESVQQPLT